MTEPEGTFDRARLKKQSQFAAGLNELKYLYER